MSTREDREWDEHWDRVAEDQIEHGALGVAELDPFVHIADSLGVPECGAPGIWHAGESNVTEHRQDVTCTECADIADERRFERDEEDRLFHAGTAIFDRMVERDIESRRER